MTIQIIPCPVADTGLQWKLKNTCADEITRCLGFAPNAGKEWSFTADGQGCAIWPYGLEARGVFSAYGPREVLESLFPGKVVDFLYWPAHERGMQP